MLCRDGQETRINVLLATLSPLLQSTRHNVSEVLPHAAKDSTSCATTGRTRAPHTLQRKLLETIATLCSLHDVCTSAAVTLEVASDRATLFISTDDTAPQELRRDVESWVTSIRAIAEDWASDADPPDGSFSVEEHSEAVLMANVYRACYATIRARIREDGGLAPTLRKLSDELPLERKVVDDPDTPLGKLCTNLELLVSCTDPETAEENGEIRLAAACIAGWAADQALRQDWVLCRIVDGIDNRAIQVIREACAVSALVDTLVTIAKCGGVSLALPLVWAVEWVSPPSIPIPVSSSSAVVSMPDGHAGPAQHPESSLIRHIVDNALSVHPYIATSALPCYPCVMLMRSVNLAQSPFTQSGTGCDFMLRGCDAGIVSPWSFPWIGCEEDFEHAEDILRELELGLERDLQLLQDRRPGVTLGDVSTLVRGLQEKSNQSVLEPPMYVECTVLVTPTV
ncbi:hypothetical protein OH76DRAFT_1410536 [Lentinus brumalis]|uniref:Uncharacterized protein n=1 Tax=Lentinus brumalis TaxID=2498619 RepID=A0A371CRU5_9APHY|nr:hypothetical protein OH76DRAFT_1410536 [Polyporus brumalis]